MLRLVPLISLSKRFSRLHTRAMVTWLMQSVLPLLCCHSSSTGDLLPGAESQGLSVAGGAPCKARPSVAQVWGLSRAERRTEETEHMTVTVSCETSSCPARRAVPALDGHGGRSFRFRTPAKSPSSPPCTSPALLHPALTPPLHNGPRCGTTGLTLPRRLLLARPPLPPCAQSCGERAGRALYEPPHDPPRRPRALPLPYQMHEP